MKIISIVKSKHAPLKADQRHKNATDNVASCLENTLHKIV